MTRRQFGWRIFGQVAGMVTAGGLGTLGGFTSGGRLLLLIGLGMAGIMAGHALGSMNTTTERRSDEDD